MVKLEIANTPKENAKKVEVAYLIALSEKLILRV